jgi:hypothetical protein
MWDNFGLPSANKGARDEDGEELDDITNDMPYADEPEESIEKEVAPEEEEEEHDSDNDAADDTPDDDPEPEPEEEFEEDGEFSFKPFVDSLAEKGVLKFDEDKEYEDSEEGLEEIFRDNARISLEEEINQYGEDFKRLLEVARNGGNPKDAFEEFQDNRYANVDIEDDSSREEFLREYYETLGMDEETIEDKLSTLEEAGESFVKKEAELAKRYMMKLDDRRKEDYVESIKNQKKEQEELRQEAFNTLKETINSTDELNGFALNKQMQKKLFEHITKPVTKDGKTQIMLNRADPHKQLFAAYLDMIDYDVNKLEQKAKSKATTEIRKAIMGFTPKAPKGTSVKSAKSTKRIPRGVWDSRRELED